MAPQAGFPTNDADPVLAQDTPQIASGTGILDHENRQLISLRSHMPKPFPFARVVTRGSVGVAVTLCVCLQVQPSAQQAGPQQVASPPSSSAAGAVTPASRVRRVLDRYCVTCHNE